MRQKIKQKAKLLAAINLAVGAAGMCGAWFLYGNLKNGIEKMVILCVYLAGLVWVWLKSIQIFEKPFDRLMDDADEAFQNKYKAETMRTKAEMHALQSQINPHFLYNTLDSINWIALTNGQDEISEMITALSSESAVPYRSAKAPDIWADEDAAEDVGFMPHTVCRRQEGAPGVQALLEDRALNSFAAGETAGTENTAAPQMEAETPHQTAFAPVEEEQRRDPLRFVGEVFDTYIVTQRGNDMCLLDKHAAHERIIYESLAASYGKVSSQMLLVPVTVQLSAEEKDALVQSEMLLQDSGLEVEDFGGNSVVVRAVPADVVPEDVEDLVVELASRLVSNPRYTTSEKTEWVLHSIACRAAIKAGDKTHAAQLLRLAEDVLDGRVPPFCPHGRPIVLKITKKELEKQFGRQG